MLATLKKKRFRKNIVCFNIDNASTEPNMRALSQIVSSWRAVRVDCLTHKVPARLDLSAVQLDLTFGRLDLGSVQFTHGQRHNRRDG